MGPVNIITSVHTVLVGKVNLITADFKVVISQNPPYAVFSVWS